MDVGRQGGRGYAQWIVGKAGSSEGEAHNPQISICDMPLYGHSSSQNRLIARSSQVRIVGQCPSSAPLSLPTFNVPRRFSSTPAALGAPSSWFCPASTSVLVISARLGHTGFGSRGLIDRLDPRATRARPAVMHPILPLHLASLLCSLASLLQYASGAPTDSTSLYSSSPSAFYRTLFA